MKKYLIAIVVLVMVGMGLFILKQHEIRARYTGPIYEGYDISVSETIIVIVPAEAIGWDAEVKDSMEYGPTLTIPKAGEYDIQ